MARARRAKWPQAITLSSNNSCCESVHRKLQGVSAPAFLIRRYLEKDNKFYEQILNGWRSFLCICPICVCVCARLLFICLSLVNLNQRKHLNKSATKWDRWWRCDSKFNTRSQITSIRMSPTTLKQWLAGLLVQELRFSQFCFSPYIYVSYMADSNLIQREGGSPCCDDAGAQCTSWFVPFDSVAVVRFVSVVKFMVICELEIN